MRKIHVFERLSADGYFASLQGDIEWVVQDPELDRDATSGMPEADAMLFGRKTYEGFQSFWPKNVDASPHGPERHSDDLAAMGRWINASPKYVFSNTLRDASWHGTELLGAFDPAKVVALKQRAGNAIMIFGSGEIVSLLSKHGLVDYYTLVYSPVVLGDGARPLHIEGRRALKLKDVTSFPTGNVRIRYET